MIHSAAFSYRRNGKWRGCHFNLVKQYWDWFKEEAQEGSIDN